MEHALAGDFEALCAMAASRAMCQSALQDHQASTPTQPPAIKCVYRLPERRHGGATIKGGQVVVVEGVNGQERPFTTDFFVFSSGGKVLVQNVVWWSGATISQAEPGEAPTTGSKPRGRCSQ